MKTIKFLVLLLIFPFIFACKGTDKTEEKTDKKDSTQVEIQTDNNKTVDNGLPAAFKDYQVLKLPIILEETKDIDVARERIKSAGLSQMSHSEKAKKCLFKVNDNLFVEVQCGERVFGNLAMFFQALDKEGNKLGNENQIFYLSTDNNQIGVNEYTSKITINEREIIQEANNKLTPWEDQIKITKSKSVIKINNDGIESNY
jgi:hypothetical protein